MFVVNTTDKTITLSRGDTGWVPYRITGVTLTEDDRVIFTIKNSQGAIVKETVFTPINNVFWVRFENTDTDGQPVGIYQYDIRVVIGPIYDDNTGRIIDGQDVKTPLLPTNITLLNTVGEV